jgi:hypothetical protein
MQCDRIELEVDGEIDEEFGRNGAKGRGWHARGEGLVDCGRGAGVNPFVIHGGDVSGEGDVKWPRS